MSRAFENSKPAESEFLVVFCDLTGFSRMSTAKTGMEIFDFLSSFYEKAGDAVESAGGKVVKFMGDAFLAAFPADRAEDGILALLGFKEGFDAMMSEAGVQSNLVVKAHFGPAVSGMVGTRKDKRFDLFGGTVNTAAMLKSSGFAITPQAFRKLGTAARKKFKKHTPPVVYIPLSERHNP